MDETGKLILGLIIAVLIIVSLIYFFIYLVIPVAIYFIGKRFYTQIKRCELGSQSKMSLIIIGGLSILIATMLIRNAGINDFVIAPLSGLIFLLIAVPVISIWINTKKRKFLGLRYSLENQKKHLETKIKETVWDIERLTRENQTIDNKYEYIKKEKDKINNYLRELCRIDPRTYMILKREWESQYRGLNDAEIKKLNKDLSTNLKNNINSELYQKIEYSIKLCLLKIEELKRILSKPINNYDTNSERIQTLLKEKNFFEKELTRINNELKENESAYQAFLRSRIVLD